MESIVMEYYLPVTFPPIYVLYVKYTHGRLDVFNIDDNCELTCTYCQLQGNEAGAFSGWEKLEGTCTSSPKVLIRGPEIVDIFTRSERGGPSNISCKLILKAS